MRCCGLLHGGAFGQTSSCRAPPFATTASSKPRRRDGGYRLAGEFLESVRRDLAPSTGGDGSVNRAAEDPPNGGGPAGRLQRPEEQDEGVLLGRAQPDREAAVVGGDHLLQGGGRAVVEVGRAPGEAAQRRNFDLAESSRQTEISK